MSTRTILGIIVILVGLFLPVIQERIPDSTPAPTPDNNPIGLTKPEKETLEKVSSIAELVTDTKDRLNLCIFNKVFSERVKGYSADVQQINDIYTEAGKTFFGETLRGKYEGYGALLLALMKDSLGSENHTPIQEEKDKLSTDFGGLAWCFW
jgi:hypothetical protein